MTIKNPLRRPRHFSRKDIGLKPFTNRSRLAPTRFARAKVEGIALHWPAIATPIGNPERVKSALRAIQTEHMNRTPPYADIAYQVAVDQDGNTYRLRGLRFRSAANGSTDVNERFGAILLVIAQGEQPTPAMIESTRRLIARHRKLFPSSKRIVGHGQIRPGGTECPGPAVQRLIAAGDFDPTGRIR